MLRKNLRLVIFGILLFMMIGCEDGNLPFDVSIEEVTATMDTVTITFSEDITEITMPNSISFASGTFQFAIEDPSENAVTIGLLEWDENSPNTITFAVLGKNATTISGEYNFALIVGDDEESVLETRQEFQFSAWTGATRYLDIFQRTSTIFRLQVMTNTEEPYYNDASDTNLVIGLAKQDFLVFDTDGNQKDFTFPAIGPEYTLNFSPALPAGTYWLRFSKPGYKPAYDSVSW